jgi:hypothetical protein
VRPIQSHSCSNDIEEEAGVAGNSDGSSDWTQRAVFGGCRDMDLPEIVDPGAFKEMFFETRAAINTRIPENHFRTLVHNIGIGKEAQRVRECT